MAWIKTIKFEDADEELQDILMKTRMSYPQEYATPAPHASSINESIVDSHTLIPDALYHSFSAFSAMMSPDLPLERRSVTIVKESETFRDQADQLAKQNPDKTK